MKGSLFGPGTIVLGGGAVFLVVLLFIGFLLPTEWSASAEARLPAAPEDVLGYLDAPEGWRAWTEWPDSGLVREGPPRGDGARITWSDRELGSGSFTISSATVDEVRYEVTVDGAANTVMTTHGTVALERLGTETLVSWTETGDLGRNPLMGFWALSMEEAQSAELAKSLGQLRALLDGSTAPGPDAATPADSAGALAPR